MTISSALRAFILADTTLAAKVLAVYPSTAQQNPPACYAVTKIVSNPSWSSHQGATDMCRFRIEVTFWGRTNIDLEGLCNRLRVIVKGFRGLMGGSIQMSVDTTSGPRSTYNPDTREYGYQLDIMGNIDMSTVS